MISFREIDENNYDDVLKVSLFEHQVGFIETVKECLDEAAETKEWCPVGIYNENQLIGFAMYGAFSKHKYTWIDRIMIDKDYQGKGYGKEAMLKLIDIVTDKYQVDDVYLSLYDDNKVARQLYERIGFHYINEKDKNGELIFKYTRN